MMRLSMLEDWHKRLNPLLSEAGFSTHGLCRGLASGWGLNPLLSEAGFSTWGDYRSAECQEMS